MGRKSQQQKLERVVLHLQCIVESRSHMLSPLVNTNNLGVNLGNIANMFRLVLTRIYVGTKIPVGMSRDPSPGDSRFF